MNFKCPFSVGLKQWGSWPEQNCCVNLPNAPKMCVSFHAMGYGPSGHNPRHLCFPLHTLHYSTTSSCGCSKSQTPASRGNVVRDPWTWRAGLLLLARRVVHEGVGSEVRSKLSGWQKDWGRDWCGNAWRSSPILSIMGLDPKHDAVWCTCTQRV